MTATGATPRWCCPAGPAGFATWLAALGAIAIVLAIAGSVRAGVLPVLAERTVCVVRSVLAGGAATCGQGGARPLLQLVQDGQTPPNRPQVEEALRRQESGLRAFFGAAQRALGIVQPPPRVTIEAPAGAQPGFESTVALPPSPRATGGVPHIRLYVPDSGEARTDIANATFALAYLFAWAAQHPSDRTYAPNDPRIEPGVNSWTCQSDCARMAELLLQADCMAGAYATWARRQGLIDDVTVDRVREALAAQRPGYFISQTGFPSGPERRDYFLLGLRLQQFQPRPIPHACLGARPGAR
ncbi:MAG TPA: hypothetical protein VGF25_07890 [Thermoleophilaceae bacterium]